MNNPNPCDKPERQYTATPEHDPGQTFWMVYVAGRQTPAVQHYDYNDALAEADRLAHKEIGRPVYLLRAERYGVVRAPVEWHECKHQFNKPGDIGYPQEGPV